MFGEAAFGELGFGESFNEPTGEATPFELLLDTDTGTREWLVELYPWQLAPE